mgnify:FL=1
MKKVRVAIVGCKNMGRKHLAVLQKYFADKVKIAGILNSTAESTAKAASELQVPAFTELKDINHRKADAVIIATPTEAHYPIAKELINKRFPLLIEKPFAENYEQCFELTKLAQSKKVPILVGHTENYNPAVIKLRELLSAPLKSIAAIRTSQTADIRKTNIISELMIHDLGIVSALLSGSWTMARIDKEAKYRWDQHAVVELKYECGTIVRLEALRHPDAPLKRQMRLIDCQNNIWVVDFLARRLSKNNEIICEGGDSLSAELADFLNMITSGAAPQVDAAEAGNILRLCGELEAECEYL